MEAIYSLQLLHYYCLDRDTPSLEPTNMYNNIMWMLQRNDSFMTPAFLSVSHRNKIHLTHNEHKTAYLPTVNVYGDGSIAL